MGGSHRVAVRRGRRVGLRRLEAPSRSASGRTLEHTVLAVERGQRRCVTPFKRLLPACKQLLDVLTGHSDPLSMLFHVSASSGMVTLSKPAMSSG